MAVINVIGSSIVVTSSKKLEDIKAVEKYRPSALVLKDDEGEPVFRVAIGSGAGSLTRYGAEFAPSTINLEGKATITMAMPAVEGDASAIRGAVADTVGTAILSLNKVEDTIDDVLAEVQEEREAIMANIVIA